MSSSPPETGATRLLPASAPPPLALLPDKVGSFVVERRLGEGGMGTVLLARDEELHRQVAIKLIRGELAALPEYVERMMREARLCARLQHPNIVGIHAVGRLPDGGPYLVMEYVEGQSLAEMLRTPPPMPLLKVLELIAQCAGGLQAAAEKHIVHRDIKPANILVTPGGVAKITDFGLSKSVRGDNMTVSAAVLGTPDYMAPEQAAGHPADFRVDVYALGVTLFQCCAGYLPFRGGSMMATIENHRTKPFPRDARIAGVARGRLQALMERMAAKDSVARPNSFTEIAEELRSIAEQLRREGHGESLLALAPPLASSEAANPLATGAGAGAAPASASGSRAHTTSSLMERTSQLLRSARRPAAWLAGIVAVGGGSIGGFLAWQDFQQARHSSPQPQIEVAAPNNPATDVPPASLEIRSVKQSSTAADLLRALDATTGEKINLVAEAGVNPAALPVVYALQAPDTELVLQALAAAAGWKVARGQDGLVRLGRSSNRPAPEHPANPAVSVNTMRGSTVRELAELLRAEGGMDFLLVGEGVPETRTAAAALRQVPLSTAMAALLPPETELRWSCRGGLLVISPASP